MGSKRPGGKGRRSALIWNRTKGGESVMYSLPSLAGSPDLYAIPIVKMSVLIVIR